MILSFGCAGVALLRSSFLAACWIENTFEVGLSVFCGVDILVDNVFTGKSLSSSLEGTILGGLSSNNFDLSVVVVETLVELVDFVATGLFSCKSRNIDKSESSNYR